MPKKPLLSKKVSNHYLSVMEKGYPKEARAVVLLLVLALFYPVHAQMSAGSLPVFCLALLLVFSLLNLFVYLRAKKGNNHLHLLEDN